MFSFLCGRLRMVLSSVLKLYYPAKESLHYHLCTLSLSEYQLTRRVILCLPHTNALIVQFLIYKEPTIFLPFTIVDLSKICVRFIPSFAKVVYENIVHSFTSMSPLLATIGSEHNHTQRCSVLEFQIIQ
jgi:hypothetical protein